LLLTDLLTTDRIKIPLEARTKDDVLCELVDVAMKGAPADDREAVLRAVRDREAVLSTGIGYGVAIPHGKTGILADLRMAAGKTVEPLEFDALDGQAVQLYFLLVGPEAAAGPHIKALSRISRLVRKDDVRAGLIDAADAAAFMRTLRNADEA
jgi:mannitol/fructose-specific phosphotransferase system IIA component (Ntr-type)